MHTIVFVSGVIGSGKTYISDSIVNILQKRNLKSERVSYATALKKHVKNSFGITKDGSESCILYTDFNELYAMIHSEAINLINKYKLKYSNNIDLQEIQSDLSKVISYICMYHALSNVELKKIYARFVLQTWGTEIGRIISNGYIWADYLIEYIKSIKEDTYFIIDDLRFISEYERVIKYGFPNKLICIKGMSKHTSSHSSETEQALFREKCDDFIWNTYDEQDITRKAYTFVDTILFNNDD